MGLASAGGFLKLDFNVSIEVCAERKDDASPMDATVRIAACGNLEDKRRMMWITPAC
jgi:hypothetical protein